MGCEDLNLTPSDGRLSLSGAWVLDTSRRGPPSKGLPSPVRVYSCQRPDRDRSLRHSFKSHARAYRVVRVRGRGWCAGSDHVGRKSKAVYLTTWLSCRLEIQDSRCEGENAYESGARSLLTTLGKIDSSVKRWLPQYNPTLDMRTSCVSSVRSDTLEEYLRCLGASEATIQAQVKEGGYKIYLL